MKARRVLRVLRFRRQKIPQFRLTAGEPPFPRSFPPQSFPPRGTLIIDGAENAALRISPFSQTVVP